MERLRKGGLGIDIPKPVLRLSQKHPDVAVKPSLLVEDDASLESLCRPIDPESSLFCNDDSLESMCPPPDHLERRLSKKQDRDCVNHFLNHFVKDASTKTIELYQTFTYNDPVIALQKVYERRGIESIGEYFDLRYTRKPNSTQSLWRCCFRCPLSIDLKTSTPSCLPLPLLISTSPPSGALVDQLMEHTVVFLGQYMLLEGVVYFRTRRAAQKSAAFRRLLQMTQSEDQNIFFESTRAASLFLADQYNERKIKRQMISYFPSVGEPPSDSEQYCRIPGWAYKLGEAGILAKDLSITYQEYLDETLEDHSVWNGGPTLIYCTIEVTNPTNLKVLGSAYASKKLARDSAVEDLCSKLSHRLKLKRQNSKKHSTLNDRKKLEEILAQDQQKVNYLFPLPKWACQPFDISSNPSKQLVYLYELHIKTALGKPLVAERLGIPDEIVTPLALIFPADIEPPGGFGRTRLDTNFELPSLSKGELAATTVHLGRRSILNLDDFTEKFPLEKILRFNCIWFQWKQYLKLSGHPEKYEKYQLPLLQSDSKLDRTYLFVPLRFKLEDSVRSQQHSIKSIDWRLVDDVINDTRTPYLLRPYQPMALEFDVCPWSLGCFLVLAVIHVVFLHPCLRCHELIGQLWKHSSVDNQYDDSKSKLALVMTSIVVGVSACFKLQSSTKNVKDLRNCLLIYEFGESKFLFCGKSNLSSRSPLRSVLPHASGKLKRFLKLYNLEFDTASFQDFLFRRYGVSIWHSGEPLIEVINVDKTNPIRRRFQGIQVQGKKKFLVPELVQCLPLPVDLLFTASIGSIYLPKMERQIKLIWDCNALKEAEKGGTHVSHTSETTLSECFSQQNLASLPHLIDAATTVNPVLYQRLEFLGDRVLGYCLALKAMHHNASLDWDGDDLDGIISCAGKNTSLVGGAIRAGFNRLVRPKCFSWQSAYCSNTWKTVKARPGKAGSKPQRYDLGSPVIGVPDFRLSDIVESVLGAAFLYRYEGHDDAAMLSGILDQLSLPFSACREGIQERVLTEKSWIGAPGFCFVSGYVFQQDEEWQSTLSRIRVSLSGDLAFSKRLAEAFQRLSKAMRVTTNQELFRSMHAGGLKNVLFFAAMYDIDPHWSPLMENHRSSSKEVTRFKLNLALLRDTLSTLGSHALSMKITEELYRRYPNALAGDLNLLHCCTFSVQIMCYVVTKNRIHECLFDQDNDAVSNFIRLAKKADSIGVAKWQNNNGWILKGGQDEYRRRCKHYGESATNFLQSGPRYPGVAGGRLLANVGQHNMTRNDTLGDLAFSFKAILGAMVLSVGVERMWVSVGPMFEELLLLSSNEVRVNYGDIAPFVEHRMPGKQAGGHKKLKYSILE